MKKWLLAFALAATAVYALAPAAVQAQTRTGWQMNPGEGVVTFPFVAPQHGDPSEYDFATIPPVGDVHWGPAPDASIIGYSIYSTLCGVVDCLHGADFTYFQTFVDIPTGMNITTFTIAFSGVDDGVRVTIFNSLYPTGIVVPGSYVYLGGSGTSNLAPYVLSGEVNRVIVTHVDDCCSGSYLSVAQVVLNGGIVAAKNTSWGHVKSLYR